MFKNLSRRVYLQLRSFIISLLAWCWLKPVLLNIKLVNFFTKFLAGAKIKVLKDINLFELATNTKLFLTTDSKRAPYGPQITKRADEEEDWRENVYVKSSIERLKQRIALMQHEGEVGLIKRSYVPKSPDEVPPPLKPLDGYTTVEMSEDTKAKSSPEDLANALKNMAERLRARGLVKEIKNEVGKETEAEVVLKRKPAAKKKTPAVKKKTNKKAAIKVVSKKKKIRR